MGERLTPVELEGKTNAKGAKVAEVRKGFDEFWVG
jgi:hypothetical protein